MSDAFADMVAAIPQIGVAWHAEAILENSRRNRPQMDQTVRAFEGGSMKRALIISAGPSLYRNGILARIKAMDFMGAIVAIDGSYVQCLRAGILPHYVVTLDPHPTRIVRWFGDPDFAANSAGDDYFSRQDLDEAFRHEAERTNADNIAIVDRLRAASKLVICSTAPANVVARTQGFDRYWFAPLVDNPRMQGSLTRRIAEETGLPSLNTGGTVGTAAVMFAHQVLKAKRIAVVGMDLGYAADMPLERTQSWNMLKDHKDVAALYPRVQHPVYGECYVDPTYSWYRQNLLKLLKAGGFSITNCTEGGALYGPHVEHASVEEWARG